MKFYQQNKHNSRRLQSTTLVHVAVPRHLLLVMRLLSVGRLRLITIRLHAHGVALALRVSLLRIAGWIGSVSVILALHVRLASHVGARR